MRYGDNWIKVDVPLGMQNECNDKIAGYFKWNLCTKNEHYAHVLICQLDNQEELEENWKKVVNCAAVYVQGELESLLERSNLYVWFFVGENIDIGLKREIENDTYSSKKFVVCQENFLTEKEKLIFIQKKIFSFSFDVEKVDRKMIQRVELQNFRIYKGKRSFSFLRDDVGVARLVVLFAPNGMGKTSFFDAVEWNLTGEIERFAEIKNKNVEGQILCNTELACGGSAYAKIYTGDQEWLKRTVSKLGGHTNKDSGKGRTSASKGNPLKKFHGGTCWKNIILQHHKIDGFISARIPNEWYREWGNLWDSDNTKRNEFESSYKKYRAAEKEDKETRENLEKAEIEYQKLNQTRPFIDALNISVQQYKELTEDLSFDIPDFKVITPEEYVKWSNEVDRAFERERVREERLENAYQYYETDMQTDLLEYENTRIQKESVEREIKDIEVILEKISKKKQLLDKYEGLDRQKRETEQIFAEYSYLASQGKDWYENVEKYFFCQKEKELYRNDANEIKKLLITLEKERDEFRVSLQQKKEYREEALEYKRLCTHLKIIKHMQEEYKKFSEEGDIQKRKMMGENKIEEKITKEIARYQSRILSDFHDARRKYQIEELHIWREDDSIQYEKKYLFELIDNLEAIEYLTKKMDDLKQKIELDEKINGEVDHILKEIQTIIEANTLSVCPVCQSEFVSTEVLLQRTYHPTTQKGVEYKVHLHKYEEEYADTYKKVEECLKNHNEVLKKLIENQKEIQRKHVLEKQRISSALNKIKEKQTECESNIQDIYKEDQGNGLFVSYSQEGIESWYELWKFKQDTEISELEEKKKNKDKEIEQYTKIRNEVLDAERKNAEKALQLYEIIKDIFAEIETPEKYIGKFSYDEVNQMYKNLKEKQREQEKDLVRLSRELESYEEWDIDKESQWVGRKMQFFQILDESNNTLRQKSDYIQKKLFLAHIPFGTQGEISIQEFCSETVQRIKCEKEKTEQVIKCLEQLKYNREVENYFLSWKEKLNEVNKRRNDAETVMHRKNEAEKYYNEIRNKINNEMQKFIDDFQISDIYEKLEPHERLKKLICEFEFSSDDKPGLTFKAVDKEGSAYIPEWYFSTAQLNVVAFSIFLGRALMSKDILLKSILIDDPIGHFDEMNVVGFVDLLRNIIENTDRQLIISTHEERVYNLIRRKIPVEEYPVKYFDFRNL